MTSVIGIIQPNFLPWRGYFDFIRACDDFVFLDTVQYTKRDWRNRNLIVSHGKPQWLTVPVHGSTQLSIADTFIDDTQNWRKKHLKVVELAYERCRHGPEMIDWLSRHYQALPARLIDLTIPTTKDLARRLGITTRFHVASDFELPDGREDRLISLCHQLSARRYLSGSAARNYMTPDKWALANIEVIFKTYPQYPAYPQQSAEFHPNVSIFDLLANLGEAAPDYIWKH